MSSSRTPSRGGKSDHSSSSTKVTSTAVESSSSSRKGGTMPKPMSPRLFRRKLLNSLPNFLPVLVYSSHVLLALHTKVEESFTLHAAHDVLAHGISPSSLSKWDHITFPGALPRSFLPPVILALLSYPFAVLGVSLGLIRTKFGIQILVRLVLAFISAQTLNHLSRTLRQRFGSSVRIWFLVLSITQFHIPFYAGRTLPNFLALPFVNLAISLILRSASPSVPRRVSSRRVKTAIIILTATATIIRLELAAFLLPTVLALIIHGQVSLRDALSNGVIGGLGSLVICAPLDLFLWRPTLTHPNFPFNSLLQLIWPEATGIWYNLFLGKASEWGESPWWYYPLNSLPKITLSALPLAALGLLLWLGRMMSLVRPHKVLLGLGEVVSTFGPGCMGLIGAMSCVGHKEWRFVVYVVPVFNLFAAFPANYLWHLPFPRLRPLTRFGLIGLISANLAFTAFSSYISAHNYPGGQVWQILEREAADETVAIHYTSYPLQSGSSLFTFLHLPHRSLALPEVPDTTVWTYSKADDEGMQTPLGAAEAGMDYVVLDARSLRDWTDKSWQSVGTVSGFGGWRRKGKWGLEIVMEDQVAVVKRIGATGEINNV